MNRKPNPFGGVSVGIVLICWLGQGLLYLLGIKKPSSGESISAYVLVFLGLVGIGSVAGYVDKVYKLGRIKRMNLAKILKTQ